MQPTSKLRFIERETKNPNAPLTIRVLQQLWVVDGSEPYEEWLNFREGEWRDVPLEKE